MFKKIFKVIRWVLSLTFISTILAVVVYRFIPVYFTPLMISRCFEQIGKGESVKLYHEWVPLEKMSKSMPVAVMASEDQRFKEQYNIDRTDGRVGRQYSFDIYELIINVNG